MNRFMSRQGNVDLGFSPHPAGYTDWPDFIRRDADLGILACLCWQLGLPTAGRTEDQLREDIFRATGTF